MDAKKAGTKFTFSDIKYIFTKPRCGDDSETHTVREWLNEFGIPLEDEFFLAWHQLLFGLGSILCKIEKVLSEDSMSDAWTVIFIKLYLDYDMSKEFMPQFEENAADILTLMCMMPTEKGKKNGGK